MDSSAISSRLIGSFIVEKGLITEEQLELALDEQQTSGRLLGEILVERFGVTRANLESALETQRAANEEAGAQEDSYANAAVRELAAMLDQWGSDENEGEDEPPKKPIGQIFVERGFITSTQLDDALEEQKWSGRKLGEILMSSGRISRLRLWDALEEQAASFDTGEPGAPSLAQPPQQGTPSLRQTDAAELRAAIESLAARVAAITPTSDDWKPGLEITAHRVEELRDALTEVAVRVDELAGSSGGAADEVSALNRRIDELAAAVGQQAEQVERAAAAQTALAPREQADALRGDLSALVDRVDRLDDVPRAVDELRAAVAAQPTSAGDLAALEQRIGRLADTVNAHVERFSANLAATATREQAEALRHELDGLRTRIDDLPVLTGDLSALVQRVDQLDRIGGELDELRGRVGELHWSGEGLDAVRHELGELRGAVGALQESPGWHEPVGRLWEDLQRLGTSVDEAPSRELVDGLRGDLDRLREAFENSSERSEWREAIAVIAHRVDELAELREGWRGDVDQLAGRIDGLSGRVDDTVDVGRVEALRGELDGLRSVIESFPVPTDEWRHAVAALAVQFDDVRTESEEWRGAVAALAVRVDGLQEPSHEWRAELTPLLDRLRERVGRLEHDLAQAAPAAAVEVIVDRLDDLSERLEKSERRLEKLTRRAEELAPLRRVEGLIDAIADTAGKQSAINERLDTLESSLSDTRLRADQFEPFAGRVHELEHRVSGLRDELTDAAAEHSSTQAQALDSIREEVQARLNELESQSSAESAARRSDLTAVRAEIAALGGELAHSIARLNEREGHEDAAREATAQAIRDGLAELGLRLTATEEAYLESGRTLRRSIEGLGNAISGADAHLDRARIETGEHTEYVAFIQTDDGYRVVDCDGTAPFLGQVIELPGEEGTMLRVARLGRSPLPFDDRPCAYLEPVSSATG